uniref:FERM domain-containing protein n=1 Tax=Globodera pallida TaxID=36090 RepID=A0A183BTS4_GLOPA
MTDNVKLGICVVSGRTGGDRMVPPNARPTRLFTLIWNQTEGLVALLGQKIKRGTWVLFTLSTQTLGICVVSGRTGGDRMMPPSARPTRLFTLIWNQTEGLVALLGQKIKRGTWVLFTLSTQTVHVHFVDRKMVDNVSKTHSFYVMAFVRSLQRYNDYFRIGMDELLGWVLVSEDCFVRKLILHEDVQAQLSTIYKEDCVRGFNWVAIAVNERLQGGSDCYRKIDCLPRFLDAIASEYYISREKQFAERRQLRNPLPPMFISEHGHNPTIKTMLSNEYALGLRYAFEVDYERDINAAEMMLTCLVVFKCDRAALVYNKEQRIGVIRSCDFDRHFFMKLLKLFANWEIGWSANSRGHFLPGNFSSNTSGLMLALRHGLRAVQPPNGLPAQIRHFRESTRTHPQAKYFRDKIEDETHTYKTVMVNVPVHFTSENVRKVRRRKSKGSTGMLVKTVWGNVFIDTIVYSYYNFEGRHLALWVSCLPQRITTLTHENCFWYFVGELRADPFKPTVREEWR